MPSPLSKAIALQAGMLPEGETVSADMFMHLAERRAVNRALAALAKNGTLARICPGVYVPVLQGQFGARLPRPSLVIERMAAATGDTVVPSGGAAANGMGLTQQVPIREIYLTTGRPRKLQFGKSVVTLRRAPQWMFALGAEPAGSALRGLAWMGEPHAKEAVKKLRRHLPRGDWERLKAASPFLPSWMADAITEEIEHDGTSS